MHKLATFFSPQGRLRRQPFVIGIALVYLAAGASHLLTVSDVTARIGLLPFAAIQAVLTWLWFTLHAKRLHDGGRGHGVALALATAYLLALLLLLISATVIDGGVNSALELILLLYIVMALGGWPHYVLSSDVLTSFVADVLALCALAPSVIAPLFTVWAATRPSIAKP